MGLISSVGWCCYAGHQGKLIALMFISLDLVVSLDPIQCLTISADVESVLGRGEADEHDDEADKGHQDCQAAARSHCEQRLKLCS